MIQVQCVIDKKGSECLGYGQSEGISRTAAVEMLYFLMFYMIIEKKSIKMNIVNNLIPNLQLN